MKSFICIVSFAILIFPALSSHADIYKYTDKSGTIHFTNIPQGKNYQKIISETRRPSRRVYDNIITSASHKFDIDTSIIKAVITAESNWDTYAISKKGAMGLMQLMPSTARDMKINNPFDPEQNIEAGTRYLRLLLDRFEGDLELAIAAYNAGPSKVESSQGIPSFPETQRFVRNVIDHHKGQPEKKPARIYKISIADGTFLYTNIPISDHNASLTNF